MSEPGASSPVSSAAPDDPPRAPSEIANLDLLRSMAVAFVMARHVFYVLGTSSSALFHPQALGIFGVLLFFVHTSLVLMMSMDRHGKADRPPFKRGYTSFIVRRAFRIFPLSMVVVLMAALVLLPYGLYGPARHPCALEALSNFFLVQNLTSYPSIIAPLWSLPIEVQMYLFLPFLFLLVGRLGYRRLAGILWPASVLIALASLRFPACPELLRYVPCFLPGVVAFDFLRERDRRTLPFWALPLAVLAMAVAYMALVRRFGGQTVWGYPVCLALGFLIGFVEEIPARLGFLRRASKEVAKYSYGIYLFHDVWISLVFGHAPWLPGFLRIPAVLVTTALSAYLGFHLIESPMIRVGSRVAKRMAARA